MIAMLIASLAQASETRLWLSGELKGEPTEMLDLSFTQHVRIENNISQFDRLMPEFQFEFDPVDWAEIGGGYRYIGKWNKEEEYDPAHRGQGDLTLKKKFKRWQPAYRFRLQRSWEQDQTLKIETRRRHRLKISHETTDALKISLAGQTFREPGVDISHGTLRISASGDVELSKQHGLDLTYHREAVLSRLETTEQHIISLGYTHEFKSKSKKTK